MSASAAKQGANRANAAHSTGPTDTSRTRFNGLSHGLTSKQTVVRGEDQNEYDTFSANLHRQLAPGSPTEAVLADRIIAAAWRLKRFSRVETSFFNNRIDTFLEANLDSNPDAALANLFKDPVEMARMRLFLRYQTSVQREYDKAISEFRKEQAERLSHSKVEHTFRDMLIARAAASPSGFAPQDAAERPSHIPTHIKSELEIDSRSRKTASAAAA